MPRRRVVKCHLAEGFRLCSRGRTHPRTPPSFGPPWWLGRSRGSLGVSRRSPRPLQVGSENRKHDHTGRTCRRSPVIRGNSCPGRGEPPRRPPAVPRPVHPLPERQGGGRVHLHVRLVGHHVGVPGPPGPHPEGGRRRLRLGPLGVQPLLLGPVPPFAVGGRLVAQGEEPDSGGDEGFERTRPGRRQPGQPPPAVSPGSAAGACPGGVVFVRFATGALRVAGCAGAPAPVG